MKLATIVPVAYLEKTRGQEMHMALAHLVGTNEAYTQFYREMGDNEDKFLMLDNSVVETGTPMPVEELIEKAKMVNADEIIVPDYFMDCDATIEAAIDYIPVIRKALPNVRIMVVPQGKTIEEWTYCLREILLLDCDTIGIPKVLTKIADHAQARLMLLTELQHILRGREIHLLGCWENPTELTVVQKYVHNGAIPKVRSCDSAIAYVYAREGFDITTCERPSGKIDFIDGKADEKMLDHNIEVWLASVQIPDTPSNVTRLF